MNPTSARRGNKKLKKCCYVFLSKFIRCKKITARFSPKARFIERNPDACGRGSSQKGKDMKVKRKVFFHGSNLLTVAEKPMKSKGKRKVTQEEIDFCLYCKKDERECKGSCKIKVEK